MPQITIIAGPNGAGKTTFAGLYLPSISLVSFVNADLIAQGLSPFAPERESVLAGKLMVKQINKLFEAGESFAVETTLAGRAYARKIPRWRECGYDVRLIFLCLATEESAISRVATRVRQGGHSVPEEIIRRRFRKGIHNFHTLYKPLADSWLLYDNGGVAPRLLDSGGK